MGWWTEHPGVLAPTALAAVDNEFPLWQGNTGQPAREYPDILAVVDCERSKINMARLQAILDESRHCGELDHRLRDPAARVLLDPTAQRIQLGLGSTRADHDALATGAVHWLHDEIVEAIQYLLASFVILQPPGIDIGENRVLTKVILDQIRDVGVDQLVVGHSVTDGVG